MFGLGLVAAQLNLWRFVAARAVQNWWGFGCIIEAFKMDNQTMTAISALVLDELILDSRVSDTSGLILLLRREPSGDGTKPAFGIRGESGMLRGGLWWQREEYARAAFAAAS